MYNINQRSTPQSLILRTKLRQSLVYRCFPESTATSSSTRAHHLTVQNLISPLMVAWEIMGGNLSSLPTLDTMSFKQKTKLGYITPYSMLFGSYSVQIPILKQKIAVVQGKLFIRPLHTKLFHQSKNWLNENITGN